MDQEPWIEMLDDREWDDPGLLELKPAIVDPSYERVDNILAIHSLDPGSLSSHLALYRQAMRSTSTLRKVDREMIAVVVSQINECQY
jgi:alkylhydroperoxidase family enzyme